MGVEPTSEGSTPTHAVLKTGEATGPHPPPRRGAASVASGRLAQGYAGGSDVCVSVSTARISWPYFSVLAGP